MSCNDNIYLSTVDASRENLDCIWKNISMELSELIDNLARTFYTEHRSSSVNPADINRYVKDVMVPTVKDSINMKIKELQRKVIKVSEGIFYTSGEDAKKISVNKIFEEFLNELLRLKSDCDRMTAPNGIYLFMYTKIRKFLGLVDKPDQQIIWNGKFNFVEKSSYREKYLKYKNKYLELKKSI
jgi:hypothetical protein